eukprot:g1427.t1
MWPRSSGCAPRGFALQPGAPSVPGASFTTRVCGDLRTRTVLAFRRQMTLSRRLHDVAVALHASPEVSDRWVLIGVVVVFWNFLIVTLAILAEIPRALAEVASKGGEELEGGERSRKTLALAVDEAEGPVPSLIPSWQELGFGRESKPEEKRPWSPSKDDLDEGLLRSEGLEATLAFDSIASSSQSLVVFGSLLPRHAEVTLTLLQRFLPTEEETTAWVSPLRGVGHRASSLLVRRASRFARCTRSAVHEAAHLLTLARLGADCGTLLAGLLDPEPGQDVDGLMQFLHGHPIGREVAHLLQERKAIGDLVTLFDLRGALDTWPASAQLCHQLFVQSCRDSRPVLVELMLASHLGAHPGSRHQRKRCQSEDMA